MKYILVTFPTHTAPTCDNTLDLVLTDLPSGRFQLSARPPIGKSKHSVIIADLDTAKNTTESLESHCRTQEQTIASLKRDLDTVSRRLKLAEDCSGQRLHEFDELSVEFSNCKDEFAELKRKFEDGEIYICRILAALF